MASEIGSAPVCAKVRARVWPAACPNLPGPAPSRCDPSPVPRFHQFPRRAAAGSNTLDQFIGDDSGKNDGANNCKLQVSWDAKDVDSIIEHAHDCCTDDDSGDGPFATR